MAHSTGILLLAAVAGYWVLERSATHKGNLKRVGQLLGSLIIILSLVGTVCRVWALATGKTFFPAGYSPTKGWFCPLPHKSSASHSESQ